MTTAPFVALSLGAGIQSTAMLLALQHGDLPGPAPALVVFADTGWEPAHTYRHLERLQAMSRLEIQTVSLYPDHSLRDDLIGPGRRNRDDWIDIPAYSRGRDGKMGMGYRQCTKHWKIVPIQRAIRQAMGVTRITAATPVVQLLGISFDELERMRDDPHPHITTRYPLVDAGWDRLDCMRWLERHYPGLQPQKSACVGCPYHSDLTWRSLSEADREDAIEVDDAIRHRKAAREQFLHRTGQPLRDVLEQLERQQDLLPELQQECSGYCFV